MTETETETMIEIRTDWSLSFGPLVPTLILLMPERIPDGIYPNANGGWSIPVWTPEHRYNDLRGALDIATDAVNEVGAQVDIDRAMRIHEILTVSRALEIEFNPFAPNIIGTISRMLRGTAHKRVTRAHVKSADDRREFIAAAVWLSLDLALTDHMGPGSPDRGMSLSRSLAFVADRAREHVAHLVGGGHARMLDPGATIEPINMPHVNTIGFRSVVSSGGKSETIETFFDFL